MRSSDSITLLLLEEQQLKAYHFKGKNRIMYGRKTLDSKPDVPSNSAAVGREHGLFMRINDTWFYCDRGSINGSYINRKKVKTGINGRMAPIILEDGAAVKVTRKENAFSPESMLLFMTGEEEQQWKCWKVNSNRVSFGTTTKDHIRFHMRIEEEGVVILEKENDVWQLVTRKNGVLLNTTPVVPLHPETVYPYDILSIQGQYFIMTKQGIICPETQKIEVKLGRKKLFGSI